MFAVINQIGSLITGSFSVLETIVNFGRDHLAPIVGIFYSAHDVGIDIIGADLIGVGGIAFTGMLIRFLWNALRGAGC